MMLAYPRFNWLVKEIRFKIWYLLVKIRNSSHLNVNKIIWVDPKKIEYVALELNQSLNMGRIISGEWDTSRKRFVDLDIYQDLRKRIIDRIEWNTTRFYKNILSKLEKGRIMYGCRTKKELDLRMNKIDLLFNEIKTNGYKLSKHLKKDKETSFHDPMQLENEVTVNIGREGDLLFNDGRHRLAIAKILKIPIIPVKVVARHSDWMEFRNELIEFAGKNQGKLYQPLTHPDLQNIPSHYGSLRFDVIEKNLSSEKGTILDIGAQLGYFCHRFEEKGFNCYAVENDPISIYFLKKLKKVEKRRFEIITESIFDYDKSRDISFDIVLALNIFHHFLKTRESYEELILLLKRIKANEMFFQSHSYDEPQMNSAYRNFKPKEFADFISTYTTLKYKLIGKGEEGRSIFKFFQNTHARR